ncbi:MAG: M20/M25/M40 family metallo-hydrolase [Methanomassiliicoccales archaeon]|jgi:acetylornithine deacetylase
MPGIERESIVELLKGLVAIDSVNPCLSPSHQGEGEIGEHVAGLLRNIGFDVRMQRVSEGRNNVIGRLQGNNGEKRLLVLAHMDTVGVDTMTIPPFDPVVVGNRLYGRGSSDTKAGLAAAIAMAQELALEHADFNGELIVAATVDEEYEAAGVEALVREVQADAAVDMEPVGMRAVIAHKGFAWQEFRVIGKAAHGSDTVKGIDAILRTGRLLEELSSLNERLSKNIHRMLGPPSLHASQIAGGEGWSTYPANCTLTVERRTVPGETQRGIEKEFQAIVDCLASEGIEASTEMRFFRPATEISPDEKIVKSLLTSAAEIGVECSVGGMAAWPEAGPLNLAEIPSVVFGPKGCTGHEADEYVYIDSVVQCTQILRATVLDFLR